MPELFSNSGVGSTDSTHAMTILVARSGLLGELPLCFVTSAVRDIPDPYHGTYNAEDYGNNADQAKGSPQLDQLARWCAENLGPYCLELIHTYMDGTTEEWKFGVKRPRGWYDGLADWPYSQQLGTTLRAHIGHVHLAMTVEGAAAANAALDAKIAAYLKAVATTIPTPEPEVAALPNITANDHTHPKALQLWRDRLTAATGVRPKDDAGWLTATDQFRNFLKALKGQPEPSPRIGPQMWAAVLAFSVAEKKA